MAPDLPAETTDVLACGGRFRLEHIRSGAHASPPGFWYEQDGDEWAVVIAGAACLEFEGGTRVLRAGEALFIPGGLRHRVAWSAPGTAWLALHVDGD